MTEAVFILALFPRSTSSAWSLVLRALPPAPLQDWQQAGSEDRADEYVDTIADQAEQIQLLIRAAEEISAQEEISGRAVCITPALTKLSLL